MLFDLQYSGQCAGGGVGPLPLPGVGGGSGGGSGPGPGPAGPSKQSPPQGTMKALNPFGCLNRPLSPSPIYSVTGGPSADWTFSANTPPGITLSKVGSNIASLSGTPTTAGIFPFIVSAFQTSAPQITALVNDSLSVMGLTNAPMLIDPAADTGFSETLTKATVNQPYSETLAAAGGIGPVTFSVDPVMIPSWVSVSSGGLITGTPLTSDAGIDFYFDVTLTDSKGHSCTQTVIIPVSCQVVCSSPGGTCPPNGTVCTAYTCTFTSVPNPPGTVYSGSLPPGLKIASATGIVTGYPSKAGTGQFQITATLPNGSICTGSFTNTIAPDGEVSARSVSAMGIWNLTTSVVPDGGILNVSGLPPIGGVYTIGASGTIHGTFRKIFRIGLSRCLSVPDYPLTCSIKVDFTVDPPPADPFRLPPGPITVGYPATASISFSVVGQTVVAAMGNGSATAVLHFIPTSNPSNDNCYIDVQFGASGQDSHGGPVPIGISCTISVSITPANPP